MWAEYLLSGMAGAGRKRKGRNRDAGRGGEVHSRLAPGALFQQIQGGGPMKEPESHTSLLPLMVILTTVLVVLAGLNGARLFQVARRTARDSAHSALWHEVNEQLK